MKYCNRILGMDIEIDLEPGIYVLDFFSGTGKSYLCKCLKALRVAGEPLDGYTYTDMIHNPSLGLVGYLNEGELGEVKVLMIDRYDLYRDKFEAEIEALSHRCVVLIDCKYKAPFEEYEVCKLSLQRRLIRVTM